MPEEAKDELGGSKNTTAVKTRSMGQVQLKVTARRHGRAVRTCNGADRLVAHRLANKRVVLGRSGRHGCV